MVTFAPAAYYHARGVAGRIIEYCGGRRGDVKSCTARFLVADNETTIGLGIPEPRNVLAPSHLAGILDKELDVFRSVWDVKHVLCLLDLDYQNPDFRNEAILNPSRSFAFLEPTYQSVVEELRSLHIDCIPIMTGQGYHFAWSVPAAGKAARLLRELAALAPTMEAKYRHDHPFTAEPVPVHVGLAHAGVGLLMEYLAHRVLERAYGNSKLPVVFTGLAVGSGRRGREAISIDLSAYGDPLFMRYTRCAFSLYHKRGFHTPIAACLPRASGLDYMLGIRSDLPSAASFAARASCIVPESGPGTESLIASYRSSPLRCFHAYYEDGKQDDPSQWAAGYDRMDMASVPPCVAWPLLQPSPALAEPTNIQNIARVLVGKGWHPRSVAGLIRSKFERDFGWGNNWMFYDAATRADFYVRMYMGLVAVRLDDLRDFNCVSHQEKGYCPKPWCGFNLASYRPSLEEALRL